MAVSLTAAQLAGALRVGDSAEETAEVERLLAYSTAAITRHLGDAFSSTPDVIVNEAAIRLCAHLFDQPNSTRGGYANALRNSGAGAILLPYRVHRAGTTAETTATEEAAALGLRLLGTEEVDVTTAGAWIATSLPVPSSTVAGVAVRGPDDTETGIHLFRTETLGGAAVAGGDATGVLGAREFALETGAGGGSLFFASRVTGEHVVYLFGASGA